MLFRGKFSWVLFSSSFSFLFSVFRSLTHSFVVFKRMCFARMELSITLIYNKRAVTYTACNRLHFVRGARRHTHTEVQWFKLNVEVLLHTPYFIMSLFFHFFSLACRVLAAILHINIFKRWWSYTLNDSGVIFISVLWKYHLMSFPHRFFFSLSSFGRLLWDAFQSIPFLLNNNNIWNGIFTAAKRECEYTSNKIYKYVQHANVRRMTLAWVICGLFFSHSHTVSWAARRCGARRCACVQTHLYKL